MSNVSYALAAAAAIMNSDDAEAITTPDDMQRAEEGALMACITMTSGLVMTINCAHLRIVGPSSLRGMFDAVDKRRLVNGVITLKAASIADIDYFAL